MADATKPRSVVAGVPAPKASPTLPPMLDKEPPTDPAMPLTVGRHKRDMARSSVFTALMVVLGGALFSPGCMDVATRLMGQKGRLDNVEKDVGSIKVEQKAMRVEQRETRDDIHALYRALVVKSPQERLENPPKALAPAVEPDGGLP